MHRVLSIIDFNSNEYDVQNMLLTSSVAAAIIFGYVELGIAGLFQRANDVTISSYDV